MNAISATRRAIRREWTTFGTLLIISVGMMGVSETHTALEMQSAANWALSPAETTINNVVDYAGSYWSALLQIDHLRTENDKLRAQNQELQEELERMPAISKLNDDWTQITAAQQSIPYQTVAARVIVRDITDVRPRTVIIDKGSNDGLEEGEVVVDSGHALIGRIEDVEATVSSIRLVTDKDAVVVGKEVKSGATGTVRGTVPGYLIMSYVDSSVTLAKGDVVVTAGEGLPGVVASASPSASPGPSASVPPPLLSPYPPGLLIGTIYEVDKDPNEVVQSARINPAAHVTDAAFLLVIINYKGGFPQISPSPRSSGSPSASGSSQPSPRPSK